MPVFRFQDIDFHYECQGQGFPLLFLHGLGGDLGQCTTMLEHTRGFRKIYMDARAHGQTTPLGPVEKLSFDQFAQDAAALLGHLGVREAVVGGISMGSGTALRLALDFPEMVKALVLVRPAWLNSPNPENLAESVVIGRLLADYQASKAERIYCARPEYRQIKESAPALAESLLSHFTKPLASQRYARLIQIPACVPFARLEDLSRIRQETLILTTEADPIHPSSIAEVIASHIPGSTLARVASKSAGVERHIRECSRWINEFLEKFGSDEKAL